MNHHTYVQSKQFIILLVLAVLTSGCSTLFPSSNLPTLIPTEHLPTIIAQTADAIFAQFTPTNTLSPSGTPVPAVTTIPPTDVPVNSPTPDPNATPVLAPGEPSPGDNGADTGKEQLLALLLGEIRIARPGALSRVASPINLHAYLVPGARGRVRIELIGENGRLIYRRILVYDMPPGTPINMFTDIDFELDGLAETARLVVSTDDSYGRFHALASVDLILLSVGASDLNPPGDLLERIVINEPSANTAYDGGKVMVSGLVRTESDKPLLIELIAADGSVVGTRQAGIEIGDPGLHRAFSSDVPYQVSSSTWVRMTIYETGSRIPGPVHIKTIMILLNP